MKLIVYDNDVLQVVVVMVEKPEALREKGRSRVKDITPNKSKSRSELRFLFEKY